MAKVSFSGKDAPEFKLITPSIYDFQIVQSKLDSGKNDNGPSVSLEFEVVSEGEFAGEKIRQWAGLDENRGWWLRTLLEATNTPFEIVDEATNECNFDTDDLLQKYVRAEVTHYEHPTKKNSAGKPLVYHNLNKFEASPLQAAAEGTGGSSEEKAPPAAASSVRRGARPAS